MQDTSPAFSSPCLVSDGFGVAFGQRVILAELDFSLPPQGVTALLGPVGSGKSTLLRTLAGLNDALVLCVSLPQGGPVVAPDCVGLGD